MARRWTENEILTSFDNFSFPITDLNEGVGGKDKQVGFSQFKKMVEMAVLNGQTLRTCENFNNADYLKPSYWNFADISNATNKPENLDDHQVGFAHLEVIAGVDENETLGAKNYVVQKLSYVDTTDNTIRLTFRGILLTNAGEFSSTTGWECSTDSADIAKSLTSGATMNGDLVAGQSWTSGLVSEETLKIVDGRRKVAKAGKADSATEADDAKDSNMLNGKTADKYALKSEVLTLDSITAGAKSLSYIGEGRNLLIVMEASSVQECFQKLRALNGDYSKLLLGDYIDIPSITVSGIGTLQNVSGNLRVEIQGFNHYYKVGNTSTDIGILFGFKHCAFTHRMNATNTNEGGYNSAELKGIVNNAFADGLQSAIGVELKTVHRLVDTHGSWTWTAERCWLPSEVEIWGHQVWGRGGYYTGTSIQYPIYAIDPDRRLKNYNGNRQWYWEGTSRSDSSANFADVGGYGTASGDVASYVFGVSPAFYI